MLFHPQILPGRGQLVLASVLDLPVTSRTTVITLRNVFLSTTILPSTCACSHVYMFAKKVNSYFSGHLQWVK